MNSGSRDTDAGPDSSPNATPNGLPGTRTVDFDPDDGRPSTLVAETVAEIAGIDPIETEHPLYGILDPDALDVLFRRRPNGEPRPGGRIEFEVAGCAVTVHGEGRIEVTGGSGANRGTRRHG